MALNPQNLIRNEDRTPEERRQNAIKAGIASGVSRRQKRDMQKAAKMLLEMPVPESQENTRKLMRSLGIEEEDMTFAMSVVVALLGKATKGDVNAARLLRDTAGFNAEEAANDWTSDDANGAEDQVIIYLPDNGRDDMPNYVIDTPYQGVDPE